MRAKALALTELFISWSSNAPPATASPWYPARAARRGSQVRCAHPDGYPIVQALIERGVIGDFRAATCAAAGGEDLLRFGFTPLYVGFADVWDAADSSPRCWRAVSGRRRGSTGAAP